MTDPERVAASLDRVIRRQLDADFGADSAHLVEAIMATFTLDEKPAIGIPALGQLVYQSMRGARVYAGASVKYQGFDFDSVGQELLNRLDESGLMIVRKDQ